MVGPTSSYDYDEAAAKKRKIDEMAFGGVDPAAVDPVEQALFGRFQAKFRPRRMCTFYKEGNCSKDTTCTFAHSLEELHPDAHSEQQFAAAAGHVAAADDEPQVGLMESNAPEDGEEVSFLSLATGPRELEAKPKALCRFFLHHPTYCLQGDSCVNAHGLSELGLDDKSVSIKSSAGPTAIVTMAPASVAPPSWACGGGGGGGGKGKEGKSSWGPYGPKGGYGMDKGGWDKGGWSVPTSFDPWSKGGKAAAFDKGGFSWSKGAPPGGGKGKGKGDAGGKTGGKMALTGGCAGAPGQMPSRFGKGGFKPTKLCTFWLADPSTCRKAADCTFAHGVQEMQPGAAEAAGVSRFLHQKTPTKMCTFFGDNACSKGLACTFAHDESELLGH